MDYYDVLGVERTASAAEIKAAFRRLARELHPDRCPGDESAARRFRAVTTAYAILSHPEKRREYDEAGTARRGQPLDPRIRVAAERVSEVALNEAEDLAGDLVLSGFSRLRRWFGLKK